MLHRRIAYASGACVAVGGVCLTLVSLPWGLLVFCLSICIPSLVYMLSGGDNDDD
jgi:hypothetical protein